MPRRTLRSANRRAKRRQRLAAAQMKEFWGLLRQMKGAMKHARKSRERP